MTSTCQESNCHSVSNTYSKEPGEVNHNGCFLTHTWKHDFQTHMYSIKLARENWRAISLISQKVPYGLSLSLFCFFEPICCPNHSTLKARTIYHLLRYLQRKFKSRRVRWKWKWAYFPLPLLKSVTQARQHLALLLKQLAMLCSLGANERYCDTVTFSQSSVSQ